MKVNNTTPPRCGYVAPWVEEMSFRTERGFQASLDDFKEGAPGEWDE